VKINEVANVSSWHYGGLTSQILHRVGNDSFVPKAVVEFLFLNGCYLHCHRRSNEWPVSLSLPQRKARRTAAFSYSQYGSAFSSLLSDDLSYLALSNLICSNLITGREY
jgi:hypothetical protein